VPAKWISSFREGNSSGDHEIEKLEGEGAHSGLVENSPQSPLCGPGESALWTSIIEPSDSNRQSLQQEDTRALKFNRPQEFSSKARTEQLERLKAADEARKVQKIPVIEGSMPWNAWIKHRHPPTLVGNVEVNGKLHRGWYFPTLFPPKATGPPLPNLLSPEDEEEFKKWG